MSTDDSLFNPLDKYKALSEERDRLRDHIEDLEYELDSEKEELRLVEKKMAAILNEDKEKLQRWNRMVGVI